MSDEEIPQTHKDAERRARIFDAMAAQLRLNKDAKFGGAFVMIPPDSIEDYQALLLNQEQPGIFWAAVKTLADLAVQSIEMAQRRAGFR
jgi:hypothetical protein